MNFGDFVRRRHAEGLLVVQPRMGFDDPALMRTGLLATRDARACTVGTITLDSYTRLGDLESAAQAVRDGLPLNGYPLGTHDAETTRAMLDGMGTPDFPVQVRHGSARPEAIFRALIGAGLHATEGGPVSYCLPYGRTPLDESVRNWLRCCELALASRESGVEPHLETFGGCMMGQLCPPSMLVALSVLEAMFFRQAGIRSLSVSYAQQTHPGQDREAIAALRRLCGDLLIDCDWHVVVYAYMGLYPQTPHGSRELLAEAARLAVSTGAARLIVKTVAEAQRIPTIAENIDALEYAAATAAATPWTTEAWATGLSVDAGGGEIYEEARVLVDAVLDCDADLGRALVAAFKRGLLDVPYCLHPDNAGRARSYLDTDGRLRWADSGLLPLAIDAGPGSRRAVTAAEFAAALSYVRTKYDSAAPGNGQAVTAGGRALSAGQERALR